MTHDGPVMFIATLDVLNAISCELVGGGVDHTKLATLPEVMGIVIH